jgi:hypothetical protein
VQAVIYLVLKLDGPSTWLLEFATQPELYRKEN